MAQNPYGKRFLIVGTILFGTTGLLGCLFALLSFMMFDAPNADKNPATLLMFFSVLTYPAVCLLAIGVSWILHARGAGTAARITICLPVLHWLGFTTAWIWLSLVNRGQFGG